jgi:hypothetical protein
MPTEEIIERIAQSAGGAFRFGKGIVSRSSVVLLVFMIAVALTVLGLPGLWKLAGLGIGGAVYLIWYFASLRFTKEHPDLALLDGAEWSAWKKFEASAKGVPALGDASPITNPQLPAPTEVPSLPAPEDEEGN